MRKIKLKKIKKKALSCLLALSMVTPTVVSLPMNIMEAYAAACTQEHKWTGLKFNFTNIPATDGGNMRWPRKTYFDEGTGDYKNFAGHYVFCIANHTNGQVDCGTEAYCVKDLTVADYNDYKGYGGHIDEGAENKKFAFCLAAAAVMWSYQRTTAADTKSPTANICAYGLPHTMLYTIEGRASQDAGSPDKVYRSKDDKEGTYKAFLTSMDLEFGLTSPTGQNKMLIPALKSELLAGARTFFDEVWSAAEVMYNAMQEEPSGTVANTYKATTDASDPTTLTVPIKCDQSTWDTYFSSKKKRKKAQRTPLPLQRLIRKKIR